MQPTMVGVRNRTDKPQTLVCDGEPIEFGPKETRILTAEAAALASTRGHVQHILGSDGKPTQALQLLRPFEIVPLAEALKVAKMTERPDIVAARKRLEDDEQKEKALTERIMARLKDQGWMPPEASTKGGKK